MKWIFTYSICILICSAALAQSPPNSINEKLLLACKNMNHGDMKSLIAQGANVNYIKNSDPPLAPILVSSLMNDSVGLAILIENKADVSIMGNAAFLSACGFAHPAIIKLLISNGVKFEGDQVDQACHSILLKMPPFMKWLFLYSLLTPQEIAAVPEVDFQESDDLIKISLRLEDKPYFESIEVLSANNFPKNNLDDDGLTPLDLAIERKNLPFIQKLVALGFPTSKYQFNTIDLASIAAAQDNIELLTKSLETDSGILNKKNVAGSYLIAESFKSKSRSTTDLLLSKQATLDIVDSAGNNLLHYATIWGESRYYKPLLASLRSLINSKNKEGISPLHQSILYDRKDLFMLMASTGNFTDGSFKSLLHRLIYRNVTNNISQITDDQLTMIQYLNFKKATLTGTVNNITALEYAVKELRPVGNNLSLIKILIDNTDKPGELNSLLSIFTERYADGFLELLTRKGVDLNMLMQFSIERSKLPFMSWLLGTKETNAARNEAFSGALGTAINTSNEQACLLLLKNGIDPNAKQPDGSTPIELALRRNNFRISRILIDNGANFDQAAISKEVLNYLKANNTPQIQKLLGALLLKKQLIFERYGSDSLICIDSAMVTNELKIFDRNQTFRLPNYNISIDQEPRFWEWFPYKAARSGGKYGRLGYLSHAQNDPETRVNEEGERSTQERIHMYVSDLGSLPTFNFGQWGATAKPKELTTILKSSIVIPACEYDPMRPLSYPMVRVENSGVYSDKLLTVDQTGKPQMLILPGQHAYFDRSKGQLTVSGNVSTTEEIHFYFSVEYNIGPTVEISKNVTLPDRIKTYTALNNAWTRINSGELTPHSLQSAKAFAYVLSLKAIEQEYKKASELGLRKLISELNAINDNIPVLYNLMFNLNGLESKEPIVELVRKIIAEGSLSDLELSLFTKFEANVNSATSINQLTSRVSEFLKEEVFVRIDDKIFEIQLLMLEAAQFLCSGEFNDRIAHVKSDLKNKILFNPTKLIVTPSDLAGKGGMILTALKY